MESLSFSKTLTPSIPYLPISSLPPSSKTLTLIPKTLKSLPSLFKPAFLSLTVASSIFLSRHSLPSLAAILNSPPPPQSSPNESNLQSLLHQNLKHHNLPEAIGILEQLIVLNPSDPDLLLLKSNLHTYSGDTEKALQGIEKILSSNPFFVEAYHGLVMAATRSRDTKELGLIAERVEGVMRICEKESKGKELRDLKLLLAQIWIIEGKYEEALRVYEEMVREEEGDFRPYLCRGIVFTLMRKMEEADRSFEEYRKLVPKDHPYSKLFENNLNGIKGLIKRNDGNAEVSLGKR